MKTRICIAWVLFITVVSAAYADQSVAPDMPTAVRVSNRDVNRFVCPGAMEDMIFSKEKGLTGHFSKNSAFIKFKIKQVGDSNQYVTVENELFLVCDGNVYTVLTQPTDMSSATIRLTPPAGDSLKKNISTYTTMPLEKQALHLIREAYSDSYPASYTVSSAGQVAAISIRPDLEVRLLQRVEVDGVGLGLKTFAITSLAATEMEITESDFLRADISNHLLAVAIEDHRLGPGEQSRVFVVEKKELRQ